MLPKPGVYYSFTIAIMNSKIKVVRKLFKTTGFLISSRMYYPTECDQGSNTNS